MSTKGKAVEGSVGAEANFAPPAKESGFVKAWRDANGVVLAPFVVMPNLGFAALNETVGLGFRASEKAWKSTGGLFGSVGELGERLSRRIADRTEKRAKGALKRAREALDNAAGKSDGPYSNQLLSETVIDETTATASLPLLSALDVAFTIGKDVPEVRRALYNSWLAFSGFLDSRASHGILKGRIRADTDALIRFGFFYMTTEGPLGAVARDFRGIVGGVGAFLLGDYEWPSDAAKNYWVSMEYVYDKWLANETQPLSDFPIGEILAEDGKMIIQRFPRPFIEALDTGDPREVLRMLIEDGGELTTMLTLYPSTAFRVTYDVAKFVVKAWLQPSDALPYVICELALVEAEHLDDEQKLEAEKKLRMTAGNATIEFEYYVPLLVPFDGTPEDQVLRKNVIGETVDHGTIAQSVFKPSAIERAQAITAEVIQMRAFLWLYGDEETARRKCFSETERKFGREAAERIRDNPLYPLSEEDVKELTRGGKRSEKEVGHLMYYLARRRGLLDVAEEIADKPQWSSGYATVC